MPLKLEREMGGQTQRMMQLVGNTVSHNLVASSYLQIYMMFS